jgi:DNA-binding GntR family transcriptional regulator
VGEHAALLAALRAGDPTGVEQIMREHIQHAGAALIAQLTPPVGEDS